MGIVWEKEMIIGEMIILIIAKNYVYNYFETDYSKVQVTTLYQQLYTIYLVLLF